MTAPRLVIFRPGALGDTLVAFPMLWSLRVRFPGHSIEWLAEDHAAQHVVTCESVARLAPEISKVHLYNRGGSPLTKLRTLRERLKPASEDTLLYLCYYRANPLAVIRDWLFFKLAGFRRILGVGGALRDSLSGLPPGEPESERIFRLISASGVDLPRVNGSVRTDAKAAEDFWSRHELAGPVVAVCPGSKMQAKRWPPDRFVSVMKVVAKERDHVSFVLIGGPEERGLCDQIIQDACVHAVNAAGLPLAVSAGILRRCTVYLGNDTGPMHLAGVLGVPCIAIFSARDRENKWRPVGRGHTLFRHEKPCAGCMLQECFAEPAECLAEIEPKGVAAAVSAVLAKSEEARER